MPSMRCYHCGKVKRCKMYEVTRRWPGEQSTTYLCVRCSRELGYFDEGGEG